MLRLAWLGARAHTFALAGTALIIALAAALLSLTGVVLQTGLSHPADAGQLVVLAESFAGTMLMVVVFVVAATVSLTLRQRRREFALLLAIGSTRRQVRRLISLEVSLLTALTAPLGAVLGLLAAPRLASLLTRAQAVPAGFRLDLGPVPVLAATLILVPVTLVAALLAARETVRVSPTAAVRESTTEPRRLGPTRRVAAAVLAVAAVPVAMTPLFVPGVVGSASSATSAFLLIGGLALAGPLVLGWIFDRTAGLQARVSSAPARLALANSRGFAQRLTTVIVPLAVALSTGTVQTGVNRAVDIATTNQLRDGIHAELVVTAVGGLPANRVDEIGRVAGVRAIEPISTSSIQVNTDAEAPSALAWEYTQVRSISPAPGAGLDPEVTSGSLAALAQPNTVAIGADARLDVGGLGRHVLLKSADGVSHSATVVAIYHRGLAFGDYLTGPATYNSLTQQHDPDTVLVQTGTGAASSAASELRRLGLDVVDKPTYVRQTTTANGAMQHLSATLLLTLLVFIGLAAANSIVLSTAGRRREFELLARTGATRRQLILMSVAESGITSLIAWVIGTVAVLPALLGVNFGLTGVPLPRIDLGSYLLLSLTVWLLPVVCTVPTLMLRSARTTAAGRNVARRARSQAVPVT